MTAKIVKLNRYPGDKGTPAEELTEMLLIKGIGIEGERKRKGERQVSLLTEEALNWAQNRENLCCGKPFKTNILLDGCLRDAELLTLGDVVLRISARKFCVHEGTTCPLYEGAAFAEVLHGGRISVCDCFAVK